MSPQIAHREHPRHPWQDLIVEIAIALRILIATPWSTCSKLEVTVKTPVIFTRQFLVTQSSPRHKSHDITILRSSHTYQVIKNRHKSQFILEVSLWPFLLEAAAGFQQWSQMRVSSESTTQILLKIESELHHSPYKQLLTPHAEIDRISRFISKSRFSSYFRRDLPLISMVRVLGLWASPKHKNHQNPSTNIQITAHLDLVANA